MKNFKKIVWIVAISLIIIIFFTIILPKKSSNDDFSPPSNKNKTENAGNGGNNSPTATTVKVGKTKTLYRFSDYPGGKVTVYLSSEADWYPKGGKIKYKTSTGKIGTDEPGTTGVNDPEPAGNFTFWANEDSAWGVEIWQ